MPSVNIILTYRCVNRCRYCFSSKTLKQDDSSSLSKNEFIDYLDFLKRSEWHTVRLLGGEPFIHPEIEEFIKLVLSDNWFNKLVIFTTGFIPRKFYNLLQDKKVSLTVNVNQPDDYSGNRYIKLVSILRELANIPVHFIIGFNIYREDFNFIPIIALAEELGSRKLRWTLAVPSSDAKTECLNREQKRKIVPRILEFLQTCVDHHLTPGMDCPIEPCIFTDEQFSQLLRLCPSGIKIIGSCFPVIDLGPGYKALRCFAAGEALAQDVRNYKTIQELDKYYNRLNTYRAYAVSPGCEGCHYLKAGMCAGGCIAENAQLIGELKTKLDTMPRLVAEGKRLQLKGEFSGALEFLQSNIHGIVLPEFLVESANVLHILDEKDFVEFVDKNKEKLILYTKNTATCGERCSYCFSSNFMWAKYYRIKKNYTSALCFLHRALLNAQESEVENIKSTIAKIENLRKSKLQKASVNS